MDIAGTEGQDILATAAGQVVYSGSGLISYGELIIVRHSENMLSAYAHNRIRLVQEGDWVRAGQKIAEMGRNAQKEALLHFEIRVRGKPVNPAGYLPKR
jgi:lipoprotein NlpD